VPEEYALQPGRHRTDPGYPPAPNYIPKGNGGAKLQGASVRQGKEIVGSDVIFGAHQELEPPLNWVREILAAVSPFVGIHRVQR
jgi:hypothetical protein